MVFSVVDTPGTQMMPHHRPHSTTWKHPVIKTLSGCSGLREDRLPPTSASPARWQESRRGSPANIKRGRRLQIRVLDTYSTVGNRSGRSIVWKEESGSIGYSYIYTVGSCRRWREATQQTISMINVRARATLGRVGKNSDDVAARQARKIW
jgi:hypothetical protein